MPKTKKKRTSAVNTVQEGSSGTRPDKGQSFSDAYAMASSSGGYPEAGPGPRTRQYALESILGDANQQQSHQPYSRPQHHPAFPPPHIDLEQRSFLSPAQQQQGHYLNLRRHITTPHTQGPSSLYASQQPPSSHTYPQQSQLPQPQQQPSPLPQTQLSTSTPSNQAASRMQQYLDTLGGGSVERQSEAPSPRDRPSVSSSLVRPSFLCLETYSSAICRDQNIN